MLMTRMLFAAGAALMMAVPSVAQPTPPQPPAVPETPAVEKVIQVREIHQTRGTDAIPSNVRAKVANCEGRKFEADASSGEGKELKRTRIVLCGKKDASNAEVAAMLQSAVDKIEANAQLPAENKQKILAQFKAKIAELKAN